MTSSSMVLQSNLDSSQPNRGTNGSAKGEVKNETVIEGEEAHHHHSTSTSPSHREQQQQQQQKGEDGVEEDGSQHQFKATERINASSYGDTADVHEWNIETITHDSHTTDRSHHQHNEGSDGGDDLAVPASQRSAALISESSFPLPVGALTSTEQQPHVEKAGDEKATTSCWATLFSCCGTDTVTEKQSHHEGHEEGAPNSTEEEPKKGVDEEEKQADSKVNSNKERISQDSAEEAEEREEREERESSKHGSEPKEERIDGEDSPEAREKSSEFHNETGNSRVQHTSDSVGDKEEQEGSKAAMSIHSGSPSAREPACDAEDALAARGVLTATEEEPHRDNNKKKKASFFSRVFCGCCGKNAEDDVAEKSPTPVNVAEPVVEEEKEELSPAPSCSNSSIRTGSSPLLDFGTRGFTHDGNTERELDEQEERWVLGSSYASHPDSEKEARERKEEEWRNAARERNASADRQREWALRQEQEMWAQRKSPAPDWLLERRRKEADEEQERRRLSPEGWKVPSPLTPLGDNKGSLLAPNASPLPLFVNGTPSDGAPTPRDEVRREVPGGLLMDERAEEPTIRRSGADRYANSDEEETHASYTPSPREEVEEAARPQTPRQNIPPEKEQCSPNEEEKLPVVETTCSGLEPTAFSPQENPMHTEQQPGEAPSHPDSTRECTLPPQPRYGQPLSARHAPGELGEVYSMPGGSPMERETESDNIVTHVETQEEEARHPSYPVIHHMHEWVNPDEDVTLVGPVNPHAPPPLPPMRRSSPLRSGETVLVAAFREPLFESDEEEGRRGFSMARAQRPTAPYAEVDEQGIHVRAPFGASPDAPVTYLFDRPK